MTELRKLLDEGYEVTLQRDGDCGYRVQARLGDGRLHTARGRIPEIAVWRASPLHEADELPPQPSLAATVEAALAETMEVDLDCTLNLVRALWRAGVEYGAADDRTQQRLDEERRRAHKGFRAATERPHLRSV